MRWRGFDDWLSQLGLCRRRRVGDGYWDSSRRGIGEVFGLRLGRREGGGSRWRQLAEKTRLDETGVMQVPQRGKVRRYSVKLLQRVGKSVLKRGRPLRSSTPAICLRSPCRPFFLGTRWTHCYSLSSVCSSLSS